MQKLKKIGGKIWFIETQANSLSGEQEITEQREVTEQSVDSDIANAQGQVTYLQSKVTDWTALKTEIQTFSGSAETERIIKP